MAFLPAGSGLAAVHVDVARTNQDGLPHNVRLNNTTLKNKLFRQFNDMPGVSYSLWNCSRSSFIRGAANSVNLPCLACKSRVQYKLLVLLRLCCNLHRSGISASSRLVQRVLYQRMKRRRKIIAQKLISTE